jgi:hypothetical protein
MASTRMTTAAVVDAIERERDRLLAAVAALGPRAASVPVTEPDGWTAKDVLAHLIHYAGQVAFGLGAPETPPPYVLAARERLSAQEWNERAVAYWADFTLEQVLAEFVRIVDRVIEFAALRTDEEMNQTDATPWAGDRPLWQFIGGDTFLVEWPAHSGQIEVAVSDGE